MKSPNRLANEKSPYLLQHAHNPVDWFPWGEEAFAKARRQQKPIFLSIGYSTCHWCHVMEHESFENEATAQILNGHFVSIKVDREERPDVDRVYMTFVQATTGSGGWPMSVFLTPGLEPFLGGTYFPPDDRYGRPGFPTVLHHIANAWEKDRAHLLAQGRQIVEALRQYSITTPDGGMMDATALDAGYEQLAEQFDPEEGGFGRAPKFPRPVTLNFLLRLYAREPHSPRGRQALEMATFTLRKMAQGGMHDQLGGGFHRYSVDRFWHIPHFEKMLYDQAQLAIAYLESFQITRDPLFAATARGILDYVQRDLTHPQGGFFSAEDADSLVPGTDQKSEGAYYLWTKAEIDHALGEDAEIFEAIYGVTAEGNAPADSDPQGEFTHQNTLIRRCREAEATMLFKKSPEEISEILLRARQKLFQIRSQRPRPHLDDKIITAWNGLMISAFARAAQVLDEPQYLAAATRAARFLQTHLYADGQLTRSFRNGPSEVRGFADDYAFLIQALLDLYETDFDVAWLRAAEEWQMKQDELFADLEGGYFSGPARDPNILLRMKEDYDGAEPSPNSVAALNLLRLAQMLDEAPHRATAQKTLRTFSPQLRRAPTALPQMLVALDFSLAPARQIVFAGAPDAAETRALIHEMREHFLPNKIVLLADGRAGQSWLASRLAFMRTATPINGHAAVYLCDHFVCQLPVTDPAALRQALLLR